MRFKLWVDDLRPPPDESWEWAQGLEHALMLTQSYGWDVVSLDHDLGGDVTSRKIVTEWCWRGNWPNTILVHSANPVGRQWLEGMIERYRPELDNPPAQS